MGVSLIKTVDTEEYEEGNVRGRSDRRFLSMTEEGLLHVWSGRGSYIFECQEFCY
jgi:hypothetical protein